MARRKKKLWCLIKKINKIQQRSLLCLFYIIWLVFIFKFWLWWFSLSCEHTVISSPVSRVSGAIGGGAGALWLITTPEEEEGGGGGGGGGGALWLITTPEEPEGGGGGGGAVGATISPEESGGGGGGGRPEVTSPLWSNSSSGRGGGSGASSSKLVRMLQSGGAWPMGGMVGGATGFPKLDLRGRIMLIK